MTIGRRNLLILVLAAIGAVCYVIFCLYGNFMPRCPFKLLTGWDCPGCGSQRAVRALFSGHPAEAWQYNLLLPFMLAYLGAIILLPALKWKQAKAIHAALTSATSVWILLGVVIAWGIIRNLLP